MTSLTSSETRMKRVKVLTNVMIALTGAFLLYWSFTALRFDAFFVFGSGMQDSGWVDDGVIVTLGQKAGCFASWVAVFCAALFTFCAAFRMLLQLRTAAFFAVETCRRIQVFGASLIVTFICDIVMGIFQFPIITWNNPVDGTAGYQGPAYYFNSASITIMLCGLGFFVLGWVFYEGAQIEADNKGFV